MARNWLTAATAVTIGLVLGVSAMAQTSTLASSGGPAPTTAQTSPMTDEAQRNIGMAQMLYKLGQTQAQLAILQDQVAAQNHALAANHAYWQAYVAGVVAKNHPQHK